MDFVYSDEEQLMDKFKTKSFIKYIISILNKNFKESFLENSNLNLWEYLTNKSI